MTDAPTPAGPVDHFAAAGAAHHDAVQRLMASHARLAADNKTLRAQLEALTGELAQQAAAAATQADAKAEAAAYLDGVTQAIASELSTATPAAPAPTPAPAPTVA